MGKRARVRTAVRLCRAIIRLATRQRQEVKRRLRERLLAMPPAEFEQLIGRLLGAMTARSGDGGIDVVADIEIGIFQYRRIPHL